MFGSWNQMHQIFSFMECHSNYSLNALLYSLFGGHFFKFDKDKHHTYRTEAVECSSLSLPNCKVEIMRFHANFFSLFCNGDLLNVRGWRDFYLAIKHFYIKY